MTEQWEIETGNEARVTETAVYTGTEVGAVRAALKRWRNRVEDETILILRRPGCQPLRVLRPEGSR